MKKYAIIEIPEGMLLEKLISQWCDCGYPELPKTLFGEGELLEAAIKLIRHNPQTRLSGIKNSNCKSCQNAKSWDAVSKVQCTHYLRCYVCGKPESEWTYATDPGGIGGGGTGGPI